MERRLTLREDVDATPGRGEAVCGRVDEKDRAKMIGAGGGGSKAARACLSFGVSKKPRRASTVPDARRVYELAEHYSAAADLLEPQAKGQTWGCSSPMILVDSFAVELYLKCLYVLDTGKAPLIEHDWRLLFDDLEPHSKRLIRETFDGNVKKHPVLANLFALNPDAVKVTDFDRSLEAARTTFAERRYAYENTGGGPEWFYSHLLRTALRQVVKLDLRIAGSGSSP